MTSLSVSIIIPAHNAAGTIAETLESLLAQTCPNWEAIVVDDGSSDETVTIVATFSKQDSRIRVVSQPQSGVSAARNTGIGLANFDWLLFLDADDCILPAHLEQLTSILSSDPRLDVAHCAWVRVTPEGKIIGDTGWFSSGDLFVALGHTNVFAIHACIVRRSLVQAVGCFNTSLRTCEDWDLWQRIARTGARFGGTSEVLAHYRIRINSASANAHQLFADGLQVIAQGYAPDPRVQNPHPAYAKGLPIEELPTANLLFACWVAGLLIGGGQSTRSLLDLLVDNRAPELDPMQVAQYLFYALPLPTCCPLPDYHILWQRLEAGINEFLVVLEAHATAIGLARRASTLLERFILEKSVALSPLTIGTSHRASIEVTEPIQDIVTPASAERLYARVELEGETLGIVELPVCEGVVSKCVLADAIAAEFAWVLLGRFFQRTIYQDLQIQHESTGLALWRGTLRLAEGLLEGEQFWIQAHDQVGWTIFLQELWGHSDWSDEIFYDPQAAEQRRKKEKNNSQSPAQHSTDACLVVEVSDELADVKVSGQFLNVVLTVGGIAIGVFTIPTQSRIVSAGQLQVALTIESGFELCRAVVREGLLGRPLTDGVSLRERLAQVAAVRRSQDTSELEATVPGLVPGTASAVGEVLRLSESTLLLGHRTQEAIGTSASRWAMLPKTASNELTHAALVAGEPLIQIPEKNQQPERVFYVPGLILHPFGTQQRTATSSPVSSQAEENCTNFYDRSYFETTFAKGPERWNYDNSYEQTKYEQTLSLLPSKPIKRALELACAAGHFTIQLAPRVGKLIAADISQIAIEQTTERCAGLDHVSCMRLDFVKDPLPGRFDLIVCSEVLYFTNERKVLEAVAQKFADALELGGYLLTAHANLVVDEPDRAGYNWDFPFGAKVIGDTLANTPGLHLVKEIHTPLYRIQLFQRKPRWHLPWQQRTPQVIQMDQPTPPPPMVAADVLWLGGQPKRLGAELAVVTDRLPILMYHRIAPTGSPKMNRWRVTPQAFEEQLCYLRDSGFYSVTLEDWRKAMASRKPLTGRAVLITFDDGYRDFLTYAWPLLKQYGFSATVFLVADKVGQSNSWDYLYSEELPLLDWQHIQQLQAEGVEFGSHSASHHPLTSLTVAEVVREGARSRSILEQQLGFPIRSFAYPHGDFDPVVEHLIGACGYVFGLSCRSGRARFEDRLLALPRVEVMGSDSLQEFVGKLTS
ncbi:glycosyltransferase [Coleofasciculus sp. LEGE 07092]|nr:glycosyltransferase [Coleofasciculus sp. LEGE 07081]MBE9149784.1 glycosyltransferase [Coleofasciculus sp. LEGE 07092]